MVWLRDLALFGFLCAPWVPWVPTIASLDTHSRHGYLLPRDTEYRSRSTDAERYIGSKHAHLTKRTEKCDHPVHDQRAVAYYEGWASRRDCSPFYPGDIDAAQWTHINFAFAVLDNSSNIVPSSRSDIYLYNETTALKRENKHLQVWIAVGGDGMGGKPFSEMASSHSSRKEFIYSAMQFMDEHDFDGIDIDWEYPAVTERGGKEADRENLVKLVKEMREEFGDGKGISMTVPARSYYLDGFDLEAMQSDLDMINVMSYDLHGYWDKPLLAAPGTNLTEIDHALQQLKKKGVSMDKVNLGLAYYGYSYVLKDSSCTEPGCPASSAAKIGVCGESKGTLNIGEIQQIIANNNVEPKLNEEAAVMYFSWNKTNWVSYDNDETLQMKTDFARDNCLGGSFVWAVDMENPKKKMRPMISGSYPGQLLSQGLLLSSFLCICLFSSLL